MVTSKKRKKAFKKGILAERKAAFWLFCKGYRIINRRFKTRLGEIDIIARKGNLILIVEVKCRNTLQAAMDSLSYNSEIRIERASDLWLARQRDRDKLSLRYDLIIIRPWRLPLHIKSVFTAKSF